MDSNEKIRFRNKETGEFMSYGEWAYSLMMWDDRHIPRGCCLHTSPREAHENLEKAREKYKRALWFIDLASRIEAAGLPLDATEKCLVHVNQYGKIEIYRGRVQSALTDLNEDMEVTEKRAKIYNLTEL